MAIDFEPTPSKIILGGLVAVLTGFLFQFGADIYGFTKNWLLSPTIDLRFVVSAILVLVGVVAVAYGLFAASRQLPVEGLRVELFFPKNSSDKTLESHKPYQHRIIIDFKRKPPLAYPLTLDSYAWNLVKKHPELIYSEIDKTPNDPEHDRKWCEKQGYRFEAKYPSRDNLQRNMLVDIDASVPFDPKLEHVQAWFFFQPFGSKGFTSKRCILNRLAMKAYPLDYHTMYDLGGRIRYGSTYWFPIPNYVQRWARNHHFEWIDAVPTMKDLLARK